MSLINDMLRNLEAKRPDDPARQNLQREIRSLPAAPAGDGRWLTPVLLIGVPLLGLAALHGSGRLLPLLGIDTVPVAQSAPAPQPAPPPAVLAPQEAITAVAPPKAPISDNELRLAPATPAPPGSVAHGAKAEPAAVVVEEPKPVPTVVAGPVRIEKSPVLATPRDRADAEYRKAENALAAGRSAEAVEGLRAALKHDPAYVQVRQLLLRQLLELRKTEEAMVVLQEGLDLQPAQTGWAMSLARLQLEHGDLAAADHTLARAQAYAEASADFAGFQGHLKSRLGAHRQAVAHYQRATRLAPNEGRWWLGLGLALEADGRVPEAKEAFKRSLATATLSAELAAVAEQHLH